jgi:hypothetical protein
VRLSCDDKEQYPYRTKQRLHPGNAYVHLKNAPLQSALRRGQRRGSGVAAPTPAARECMCAYIYARADIRVRMHARAQTRAGNEHRANAFEELFATEIAIGSS